MPLDWTSIAFPRTPRAMGEVLLYLAAGLGVVAVIAFLCMTAETSVFIGAVLASLFIMLGALLGIVGLFLRRFTSPQDNVQVAVAAARGPMSIFGERTSRHDGRPLSKEEDDTFRGIISVLEREDPRKDRKA